jgi:hypothetical protein
MGLTAEEAGKLARDGGNSFEKQIGATFPVYAQGGKAFLDFMPLPMTPCGRRGSHGEPLYIPKGKAPFDVYGHAPRRLQDKGANTFDLAVFVGAELKHTKDVQPSLSIVHPDAESGDGLKFHQLDALALVARMGGVARVVWDNGGQVGVLSESGILAAHAIYSASLASERRGKGKGPVGSRSIKWTAFKPVEWENLSGVVALNWLKIDWQDEGRRKAA